MIIDTKFIGQVEIENQDVISFENGLPGFNELNRFVLLPMDENPSLNYLQAIDEASICFIVMNPFLILEDYEIELSEDSVAKLEIEKMEDVSLYTILTIPENIQDITANLTAPIVVSNVNKNAVQEIQNDGKYSIKHKLFRGE